MLEELWLDWWFKLSLVSILYSKYILYVNNNYNLVSDCTLWHFFEKKIIYRTMKTMTMTMTMTETRWSHCLRFRHFPLSRQLRRHRTQKQVGGHRKTVFLLTDKRPADISYESHKEANALIDWIAISWGVYINLIRLHCLLYVFCTK